MESHARLAAELLRRSGRAHALAVVEQVAAERPDLIARGLPAGFADPVEDTRVRLLVLAEAIEVEREQLFAHQADWYKVAFAHRGVDPAWLDENLRCIATVLQRDLPSGCRAIVQRHVAAARERLARAPTELASLLEAGGPLLEEARRFLLAVLENRSRDAVDIVVAAHRAGATVADLHDHVLVRVQREVGRMWLMAEIPIADEHYGSRIVERCIDRLAAIAPRAPRIGRSALTFSVGGDLHDIAVRLVAERFELAGWDAWNLGANMPASDLEWMLQDRSVDAIVLGASLVLHVGAARATVGTLRAALGSRCPPIVAGGMPFEVVPDLHAVIGADATARSASEAVEVASALLR